jgi:hypothetical protein
MLVNVCYRVPVVVVVNTTTGHIERVTVDDESISGIEYCERASDCHPLGADTDTARTARRIAESDVWPAWEFGF